MLGGGGQDAGGEEAMNYEDAQVFVGDHQIAGVASIEFAESDESEAIAPGRFGEQVIASGSIVMDASAEAKALVDFLFPPMERARVRCITRSRVRWERVCHEVFDVWRAGARIGLVARFPRGWRSVLSGGTRFWMEDGHCRRVDAKRALLAALCKQDEDDVFGYAKPRRMAREMRRMKR